MNSEPVISILFGFSANYAQHAAACIASIIRNTTSPLEIVTTTVGDPEAFAAKLRASFAHETRVQLDVRQFTPPESDTGFPLPYYITGEAYIRFWVPDLFPTRTRVLYMDPDTIAVGSLEPLWATDLQGKTVGAVEIPGSTRPRDHGMKPGSLYFNSGILLIDLDRWRSQNYTRRLLDFLRDHPESAYDADQDILNLVLAEDWLPLDYTWNAINPFFRPSHDLGLSQQEIERVTSQARIIHYNGISKPWVYMDNHPRQRDYFENLARTEWRDWRPADQTFLNTWIKRAMPFVPDWARKTAKSLLGRAGQ